MSLENFVEVGNDNSLRLLGLDVGDRRIGVAVSDPTGCVATPMEIYTRRTQEADVTHIDALCRDLEASAVVVGLPKNMNGSEGPQAEKTREFADALADHGIRVWLWDERLSTVEATRRREGRGRRRKSRQERLDAEAAAVILETYLDHLRLKGKQ
jgi:putative holliday junction resolvase